jgi:hypothetical protein
MQTQVFLPMGKSIFVAGLHWETFDASRQDEALLTRLAKQLGASKLIVSTDWFTQVGFARIERKKIGARHFSLAAALQAAASRAGLPPNWIGLFQVSQSSDTWCMVAVGESVILAESDFCGDFASVKAHFMAFTKLRDYEAVVIPASLQDETWVNAIGTAGGSSTGNAGAALKVIALNDWISEASIKDRWLMSSELRRVDAKVRQRRFFITTVCVVILAFVIGTAGYYFNEQRKLDIALQEARAKAKLAAEVAAAAALAATNAIETAKAGIQGSVTAGGALGQGVAGIVVSRVVKQQFKPWETVLPVSQFATRCMRAVAALPAQPASWPLTSAACNGDEVNATYVRGANGATVAKFADRMPAAVVKADGESADLRIELPSLDSDASAQFKSSDPLITYADAQLRLNDRFQVLGVKVPLREVPLPPNTFRSETEIPEKFSAKDTPMIQDWRTLAFFVATTTPPTLLTKALDLPGLRIRSIRLSMPVQGVSQSSSPVIYQIDGEMYVY